METTSKLSIYLIGLILILPPVVSANELSPSEMAARLQATYDKTTSFTADFAQTTSMKLSRRSREGKGSMVIRKPGMMRWDYQQPDRQVLICDGEEMLMYFAGAEQMIVMPAQEYLQSDVTYAFFTGKGPQGRDYKRGATTRIQKGLGPKYVELKIVDQTRNFQPEFDIKEW